MRFSTALVAISAIAAADAQFEQYKAQFQNFLGSFGVKTPGSESAGTADIPATEPDAAAAVTPEPVEVEMATLTLSNWKDTLYGPVQDGASTPEEWWIMVTGGNKTCGGHCGKAEAAFNETAQKFAMVPGTPHMGYVNCEDESVLCHTINCWPGSLWVFDMLPPPAAINIWGKRVNLSSVEAADLMLLQASGSRESFSLIDGHWHPFDGTVAEYGLLVPAGYVSWVFSYIPNWLFMFVISMGSRMLMSRRMNNAGGNTAAGGAPPAGAAPGPAQ